MAFKVTATRMKSCTQTHAHTHTTYQFVSGALLKLLGTLLGDIVIRHAVKVARVDLIERAQLQLRQRYVLCGGDGALQRAGPHGDVGMILPQVGDVIGQFARVAVANVRQQRVAANAACTQNGK